MDIISVIAFVGTVFSLGAAVYIFITNLNMKKMQMTNRDLETYIKDKKYLLMKNGGENPCDTKKRYSMPSFSQEGNYIIRRKVL